MLARVGVFPGQLGRQMDQAPRKEILYGISEGVLNSISRTILSSISIFMSHLQEIFLEFHLSLGWKKLAKASVSV